MINFQRRRPGFWKVPVCYLVLCLSCYSSVHSEEDTLVNVWEGSAEEVHQQILKTADLPGGEVARKLADGPTLLWVERCFMGTDNAYSSEETRYAVIRVIVANTGAEELRIKREKISLRAGGKTFRISGRHGLLRDIPLQIDWHADGNVRPQSQLRTPRTINVASGKSAAFWTVFAGFDPVPTIPEAILVIEPETSPRLELDLNAQQNSRLGLTVKRLGPQQVLTVFTIQGQLNRVNSVLLAREITKIADQGGSRFLVEWSADAQPSDDILFNWLMASSRTAGEANPLQLQLPALPVTRQLLLAELPQGNADVEAWDGSQQSIFEHSRDAAVVALREIYERVSPRIVLNEVRSGHPWSRIAALETAGSRLPADALPVLLELSRDDDASLQRAAIAALGAQPQPAAEKRLHELTLHTDPLVASTAVTALLATSTPSHRALMRTLLNEHQLPLSGDVILQLLADNFHPDWESDLARGVTDPDADVRRVALEVLHQVGHPGLSQFCREALADTDETVREQAFQILVDRSDQADEQAAREYALKRLNEGHIDGSILEFVERVRETRAAPALLAEIQKPQGARDGLIQVIGEIGTNEHIQVVLDGLDQYTDGERVVALGLATRLSIPTQLNVARKVATSKYAALHFAAIEILKSIGNEEALAILTRMWNAQESRGNAEAICIALGEIGTAAAVQRLREFQEQAGTADDYPALYAVDQGLKAWRSRLPGFNFIEAGRIHEAGKKDEEAIKAFSVAMLINPDLAEAYSARGSIYLRQEKFTMAGEDFRQAMELDPFDGQAITGVAIVSAVEGDWQAAAKLVDEKTPRFARDRYFAYNTACVYSRCVATLKKLDKTSIRDQQIVDFQARSIQKLKESISRGFRDFEWMQQDPDLIAIRDLPEFKKLLTNEE